jgi:hypothetical protein
MHLGITVKTPKGTGTECPLEPEVERALRPGVHYLKTQSTPSLSILITVPMPS